jgi:hypothetical protein
VSTNPLMTLIRGRAARPLPPSESEPEPAPAPDPDLLARFLTAGGAVVELRKVHFRTRYISRPCVLPEGETRPCDGFTWRCHGCGVKGSAGTIFTEPYLDGDEKQARDDANDHAARCRSMPLGDRQHT